MSSLGRVHNTHYCAQSRIPSGLCLDAVDELSRMREVDRFQPPNAGRITASWIIFVLQISAGLETKPRPGPSRRSWPSSSKPSSRPRHLVAGWRDPRFDSSGGTGSRCRKRTSHRERLMQAFRRCPGSQNEACFPTHWQASAGFEPAVEVLQIAICSSPEFAEVHCVLYGKPECSLEFMLVRQSSPALPSPLSSKRSWEAITRPCERSLLTT